MAKTKKTNNKVEKKVPTKKTKSDTKKKKSKNVETETNTSKIVKFILCLFVPFAIGEASKIVVGNNMMSIFEGFRQPVLSPASWVFPIVWIVIYLLMGVASYTIWISKTGNKAEESGKIAWLVIYAVLLGLGFFWPIIFFSWSMFDLALFWLLAIWILTLVLLFMANRHSQVAMWCILPLALWTTFAAYLNLMIMLLN